MCLCGRLAYTSAQLLVTALGNLLSTCGGSSAILSILQLLEYVVTRERRVRYLHEHHSPVLSGLISMCPLIFINVCVHRINSVIREVRAC